MSIVINPGSGPVQGDCTIDNASTNIAAFVRDLIEAGYGEVSAVPGVKSDDYDRWYAGRWPFVVTVDGWAQEVDMPGLPLDGVRYVGTDDQNIWDFPRLYVDGSSWVWEFALTQFRPDHRPEAIEP
jgi:hypothetical protein